MDGLSVGKIRGLQQISTVDGAIVVCAMDHRESLRQMLSREAGIDPTYSEMVRRKLELCKALAPHSSAVLLDPVYGAAQCIAANVLPGGTGLLVSIEATGYEAVGDERLTTLLEDWNVEKIKRLGASAVKILVYYRPDRPANSSKQLATIRQVADECTKLDIPFLVEAVSYPVGQEKAGTAEFAAMKPGFVVETARQITALPIDVFKAEFPADLRYEKDEGKMLEYCQQVNEASRVPWVILSAGVDYDTFYKQVDIACRAGASGFLGGRAVWQDSIKIKDPAERVKYLETVVADGLKRLIDVGGRHATPWYKKRGLQPDKLGIVSEHWYQSYPGFASASERS
ncbi:MAG: tagatose 1,6-diphosphate aldolase [Bacteroidetes bacterium]|nr:tagatose 1,6-diphosphate aldolase [Bacteroidota bacterium]